MLNNYYKIEIPAKSKSGSKYKYEGTTYLLFEKATDNLALNIFLLNESEIPIGATNGEDGKSYAIKKYPDLYKFRLDSFDYANPPKPKQAVPMKTQVTILNDFSLNLKLTIKEVDSFISGSNSSGGLKTPDNDPIRMLTNAFLETKYSENLKENFKEWKVFSLLSNLEGNHNNKNFPDKVTREYLEQVEERSFSELFNGKHRHIPYGEAGYEDLYVPFDEAFASQNSEKFIEVVSANAGVTLMSNEAWNSNNNIDYIFKCIDRGDKRFLSKQLRSIWRRIIDDDIKNNNFSKDFIKGMSMFQRAHIVENKNSAEFLLSQETDMSLKERYLEMLFNNNNYILLTNEIHGYWDAGLIYFDENGNIINRSLPEEEFKLLIKLGSNINGIYENVLNEERITLLEKFGQH